MRHLPALCFVVLTLSAGCAGSSTLPSPSRLAVRVLSSEAAATPRPELTPRDATPRDATPRDESSTPRVPRIGAPGGSGAGSRRVVPAQSGNETVGGLPTGAGTGAGAGVGRG